MNLESYVGMKFGKWTIIDIFNKTNKSGYSKYLLCKCECGTERPQRLYDLEKAKTSQCGCSNRVIHNMYYSLIYKKWDQMKQNARTKNIYLHPAWNDFIKFYEDVGNPPTSSSYFLRIDIRSGYHPDNWEWGSKSDFARKKNLARYNKS